MIAKAVFLDENFDYSKVNTIITLATPHQYPLIAIDENVANFYQKVDHCWSSSNKTANVTLASIGGADRDILVRSGLTTANQPSINVLVPRQLN
jgi:glycosylphosphatidylinositol deacylase